MHNETRLRVAHVITKLELGGAQENTLYTCAHLDRRRFDVALVHGPGGLLDEDAARLRNTTRIVLPSLDRPLRPTKDSRCLLDLVALFRRTRPTIVHTHSSKAGILGRIAGKLAAVPIVIHTIHGFGFHPGQRPIPRSIFVGAERAAGACTNAFVCVSRSNLAEAQARRLITERQEAVVIRSGFDIAAFQNESLRGPTLRRELGFGASDEVIVAIANLKPQKDPITLVRAMAKIATRRPRAVLLYVGDGELRPDVEAEIHRHGLDSRFVLLGWRRDVAALMGAADVVALSSIFEGLPRSAVQAIAIGRPFVGTRVDGTSEVIREGENGYLVEPRDPDALALALERALNVRPVDPSDATRVLEWDADQMVRDQEALYLRQWARACSES